MYLVGEIFCSRKVPHVDDIPETIPFEEVIFGIYLKIKIFHRFQTVCLFNENIFFWPQEFMVEINVEVKDSLCIIKSGKTILFWS